MTDHWWIGVAQYVLVAVAGALIWSLRKAFWAGSYSTELETRLKFIEKRMDVAGEKMSEFATIMQGWPERMRDLYLTKEEFREFKQDQRRHDDESDSPVPNNRRRR